MLALLYFTPRFVLPPSRQIRDFYLLTALKAGEAVFREGGLRGGGSGSSGGQREWKADPAAFRAWAQGRTGFPFVDACMRELAQTGWVAQGFRGPS